MVLGFRTRMIGGLCVNEITVSVFLCRVFSAVKGLQKTVCCLPYVYVNDLLVNLSF